LISKEKNALESQLVIIKYKFAELSSLYGDLQDEKNNLLQKIEEVNQKLFLKEDVISHLINEKSKLNFNQQNENDNIDKYSTNYSYINKSKYFTTNNLINQSNDNSNNFSLTQRNSSNQLRTKNINDKDISNYQNYANDNIIKKIQYNFDESQYSKQTNYNATMNNESHEFVTSGNINNTSHSTVNYNKTEHQQKLDNYKALKKNQKTKSIGLIGSIKNFFINDKK